MAQCLKALVALPEALGLFPSTHIKQLTAVHHSSSRVLDASDLQGHLQ